MRNSNLQISVRTFALAAGLRIPAILLVATVTLSSLTPSRVLAASETAHPDWPCVQRRVPVISAATLWAGPPLDGTATNAWRKDPDMSALVNRLSLRRVSVEDAAGLIEKFASPMSESERVEKLPLLFQGLLKSINRERTAIIDGIERYTRKQRSLADEVRKSRSELEREIANASDEATREAARQKLDWQTRIHLEREKSLEFVCESPTILEQRAFELAREIQYHLP